MSTVFEVLFYIMGIAAILYCAAIALLGFGTYFFLIWGVIGVCCVGAGIVLRHGWLALLPKWLCVAGVALIGAAMLLFCIVEAMIIARFDERAKPGADYLIVLGAQWNANGPSEVLRRRLDKAAEYLEENPETFVIVSGGQGSNENIAEAAGMAVYLQDKGIAGERILSEDRSANTYQNLLFSAELFDRETSRVVIVTNDFHIYRAEKIAEKQGYHAEGLAASSVYYMMPNNLLREFVGVMKDVVMGNM